MSLLPAEFADLEPWSEWILQGEAARYAKRLSSSMEQIQAFYDATFPRLEEGATYLEQFSADDLPDDARNLLWLFSSLVMISFPVEVWRQPRVPDSGPAKMDCILEPAI